MLAFLSTLAVAQIFTPTNPYSCGSYVSFNSGICGSGLQQSPINIQAGIATPILSDELDLKMYYEPRLDITLDAGRDKWTTDTKDSYVTSKGERFDLIQFHFHAPSEHTIDGVVYPAEVHFVHQNPLNGKLLVVGLLFSSDSAFNSTLIEDLSGHQTASTSQNVKLYEQPAVRAIEESGYYHYDGSLTAGSCLEGLIWVVSKYVAPANELQVCSHVLDTPDKSMFETSRPTLPLNGRTVKSSVWAKHSTAVQPDSSTSTGTTVSVSTSSTTETNNDSEGGTVEAPAAPKEPMAPLLGGGEIAAIVLGAFILMVLSGLLSALCAIKVLRGSGRVNTLAIGSTPKTNGITGI